jgi:hypothetical protein
MIEDNITAVARKILFMGLPFVKWKSSMNAKLMPSCEVILAYLGFVNVIISWAESGKFSFGGRKIMI